MTLSHELAGQVAEVAQARGLRIGAAESFTGGALSSALAAAPGAAEWFHRSVVAYSPRLLLSALKE